MPSGEERSEGLRLLEEAQWAAARDVFQASLEEEETPDAHDGIGLALYFLGEIDEGIAARERAFEAYAQADRCDEAARVGVWVSHQYLLSGRTSAARGWLARVDRAVADPDCEGQGWIAIERARHAESFEERAEHTRRAMAIARRACSARSSRLSACRARSIATQPWPSHFAPVTARSARASQPRAADARPESRYWCDTHTPTRAASSQRSART